MKKRWACLLAALWLLAFAALPMPGAAAEGWDQVVMALASGEPGPVPAAWRLTAEESGAGPRTGADDGVRHILLLSTDAQDPADPFGRTELMMLCSDTGRVALISLPEQMPVAVDGLPEEIPLKYVNCFGGPLLTMQAVSGQMHLEIARYCAVNEQALIRAVDLMGGARLDLTDSEREALALAPGDRLSGENAMRYMRLRRAGSDWERPRKLLEALAAQAFEGGIEKTFLHMERLLPTLDTNLTTGDVFDLLFALLGREAPPAIAALSMDAGEAEEAAEWIRQTLAGGV